MSGPLNPDTQDQTTLALVGAAVAVTTWGSAGVLIRHIDMDGLAIAVYRFWISGLFLAAWMSARGVHVTRRVLRHSAVGGIALGIDVALFFTAVKLTTIVNATVIGSLQPILVGIVAWRFFGEDIRRREVTLGTVAIVAVVVVVAAGSGTPEWNLRGDLLAVGALFAWAAYFVLSKASREVLTPGEYTVGTALWTAAVNTPLAIVFGQDLSLPTAGNWALLTLLAVGAGVLGHVVMNWSLVRIPLWLGSTFTLLIPVFAAALAWLFLDQALTAVQVMAMVVVMAALAALVAGQRSSNPAKAEQPTTNARPVP